jgi:hypothetical protein
LPLGVRIASKTSASVAIRKAPSAVGLGPAP